MGKERPGGEGIERRGLDPPIHNLQELPKKGSEVHSGSPHMVGEVKQTW